MEKFHSFVSKCLYHGIRTGVSAYRVVQMMRVVIPGCVSGGEVTTGFLETTFLVRVCSGGDVLQNEP